MASKTRSAAAAKRRAANVNHDEIVTALTLEKAGYESRGLTDRAKAVQSEISKHQAAAKKAASTSGSSSSSSSSTATGGDGQSKPRSNRGSAKTKPADTSGDDKASGDDKSSGDSSGTGDQS